MDGVKRGVRWQRDEIGSESKGDGHVSRGAVSRGRFGETVWRLKIREAGYVVANSWGW